jgi:hypothetical protein
MSKLLLICLSALCFSALGAQVTVNANHKNLRFSDIKSDFVVTDSNKYGCEKIDETALRHILASGTKVTDRELHDYYATTGCSIKGTIKVNGTEDTFTYEYGGIMYFGKGMTLGCGKGCCTETYPNCSWDPGEK